MNNSLTKHEQSDLVVKPPEPTVIEMMSAVLKNQITPESVAVVRELAALRRQEKLWDAEEQFNTALVSLQSELPVIVARTPIQNRGKYEKFEDIMTVVGPLLKKHGFTVTFSNDFRDGRIIETCHLSRGCHTKPNSYAVRTRKADNDTQADTMAATTAKRNALCQALNIVIRQDCLNEEEDATIEGGFITKAQAEELAHRLAMVDGNRAKFLELADAESFETIRSGKYEVLDQALRKKEQQGK